MRYSLFSQRNADEYFSSRLEQASKSIEKMSDEEITGSDIAEWESYYYQLFEAHPIELLEDEITQTIEETKIKQPNLYRFYDEPEFYYIDAIRIVHRIPFIGDSYLLDLTPSRRYLTNFFCDSVIPPRADDVGYIVFGVDYPNGQLEQHTEDMQQFVRNGFTSAFTNHRNMISYINADAKRYNEKLKESVMRALDARKKRAASIALISKKLEIPLTMNSNAPNIKPIPLRRITKPSVQKPQKKPAPVEYAILETDYTNINNIIYMCGSTMEKTAISHVTHDEENLRDLILATLNTHYDNATSETFRRIGKTDIHISFENRAAFIGECKIWRGEKAFGEAIQQLLGYSTWKDSKITLIIFNKNNKSFNAILSKIKEWVCANTKSHSQSNANSWDCTYYRKDMETDVKLHIVAFDLHIENDQIESIQE